MGEDSRSAVIDIKPRIFDINCKEFVKKPVWKKSIKAKFSEKVSTLPAVTLIRPLPVATIKKEDVLLPYLRYAKKQKKTSFQEQLTTGIHEHYKIASTELKNRLYIDEPVDDFRAITDYDPKLFMRAKSSVSSNYIAPYKSLKYLYNSQLRLRQEVGYRRDCMLNIDASINKEQEIYESSLKRYMEQVKYLENFISNDYTKSMSSLSKWEKVQMAVNKKVMELQFLAAEKFTITSKILGLDYRYGLQQKYGRFLYYVSPPSWRLKNRNFARSVEIEAKGFDLGISSDEDTFNVIFENLKRECDCGLVKPALYFKHPNDLLSIFDTIEQQHLHHFTHVVQLAAQASFLKKSIKIFRDILSQDSIGILIVIKEFEKILEFCEEQCLHLKGQFYKILNGLFYETVAGPAVLKFHINLEFCYAQLYDEKPTNLGVSGIAKALEDFYMDFNKRLESMSSDEIKTAIKRSVASERHKFRIAKKATKELRLFNQLEQALLRAYAPPKVNQNNSSQCNNKRPVKK